MSSSPGYDSYMNRDFHDFTTGPLDENVSNIGLDDPVRHSVYTGTPSSYDLKKFDDELFGRSGKSNFLDSNSVNSGNDSELNLDTPHNVPNDSWISPPLRHNAKPDTSEFTTPMRHTNPSKFHEDKSKPVVTSSESHHMNNNHNSQSKSGSGNLSQWQKQHQNNMAFRQSDIQVGS